MTCYAVSGCRANAVGSELSALKKPPVRHKGMAATNTLRTRGTGNLLEAAHHIGARRFVTQSMMFGYGYDDQGLRLRRESELFPPDHQGPLGTASGRNARKRADGAHRPQGGGRRASLRPLRLAPAPVRRWSMESGIASYP